MPIPVTAWLAAGLVTASLAADALLARRFAGGDGGDDRSTCRALVISLSANTLFGFACLALPVGRLAVPGLAVAGLVLATAGLLLRYAAIHRLGKLFTWRVAIQPDHHLETGGVYGRVRHPSYTGGLMAAFGILVALGNVVPLVVFACTHLPLVVHRVRVEEPVLAAHFGEAWRAYAARTWRLFPGVW